MKINVYIYFVAKNATMPLWKKNKAKEMRIIVCCRIVKMELGCSEVISMEIKEAIKSVQKSLFWGNWTKTQADALRTLLLEVEKVKMLEEENKELRKRLMKLTGD